MADTLLPRPTTSTGVARCVVVPSPSWPSKFRPQHFTPPPAVRAHVWSLPAAICATPLPRPTTPTGVVRCAVVPSPSWPYSLYPQHFTPPAFVSAQVYASPAATAATPLPRPLTSTGVVRP